jgi:hypothetical protein
MNVSIYDRSISEDTLEHFSLPQFNQHQHES